MAGSHPSSGGAPDRSNVSQTVKPQGIDSLLDLEHRVLDKSAQHPYDFYRDIWTTIRTDVTRLKQAELALAEHEQQWLLAQRLAHIGSWVSDLSIGAFESPHADEASHDVAEPEAPRHTVLYIEDNPANIKLMQQFLLKRPSIKLHTAHLPGLGLELAATHRPDLILLDINMPYMDGYQVLGILQMPPNAQPDPGGGVDVKCDAARHRARHGGRFQRLPGQALGRAALHGHSGPIAVGARSSAAGRVARAKR